MSKLKRVSFKVDEEFHKALKHISVAKNTTMQDLIFKAVEEKYLNEILENMMKGEEVV